MDTESFWEATGPAVRFEALSGEVSADVCIVGGGITGITAAQLLAAAGKRVVVLEARAVGAGTTGYSTGNLHVTPDDGLRAIRGKWGDDVARVVARSRVAMVDHIEATVASFGLDCGFARRPHYIFALDSQQAGQVDEERVALAAAGLATSIADTVPLPASIRMTRGLRIENQAQFHPLAYTRLLAARLVEGGPGSLCRIYEGSAAVEIDSDNGVVRTERGVVRSEHIIQATHTPKGFNFLQTDLGPYREYGIAARLTDDSYPVGIFWSMEEPGHSIRSFDVAGARHLIVIGEKHKTGQHDDATDYYARVEDYARTHFPVAGITHRWSGQHYRPADGLPYVGKTLNSGRAYLATGFGTSGLLYGPVAAQILADEVLGRENPTASVYAARRVTPIKSARDFVQENVNVAAQYARDWLTKGDATDIEGLESFERGEGRLVEINGKKAAVYVDEQGQGVILSPVCTHLQCIVHWNAAEKSWDCPCHGSRFACTGEVLEGPALESLRQLGTTP